jgi:hypothetical protein
MLLHNIGIPAHFQSRETALVLTRCISVLIKTLAKTLAVQMSIAPHHFLMLLPCFVNVYSISLYTGCHLPLFIFFKSAIIFIVSIKNTTKAAKIYFHLV